MDAYGPVCYDYLVKVVVVGDSGVGKTNVLRRYFQKDFNENTKATIGVDMDIRNVEVAVEGGLKKRVELQVWDTAGQEKFARLVSSHFRGAHIGIIMYDITHRESFTHVSKWLTELRQSGAAENLIIMLIGNKIDLEHKRQVPKKEAKNLAAAENLMFMETSALDDSNIQDAFLELTRQYLKQNCVPAAPSGDKGSVTLVPGLELDVLKTKKKGCCW